MSKSDKRDNLYETVFTQPVKSPNCCELSDANPVLIYKLIRFVQTHHIYHVWIPFVFDWSTAWLELNFNNVCPIDWFHLKSAAIIDIFMNDYMCQLLTWSEIYIFCTFDFIPIYYTIHTNHNQNSQTSGFGKLAGIYSNNLKISSTSFKFATFCSRKQGLVTIFIIEGGLGTNH